MSGTAVVREASRRRTFAVISHPDAGKSTITEALALHARVIGEAGAVHGNGNRKGIAQLDGEGIVQVSHSRIRGEAAPVLAAVGPKQFEVATARMAAEFGVAVTVDRLPLEVARRTDAEGRQALRTAPGVEVFERVRDGALLAAFPTSGGCRPSRPTIRTCCSSRCWPTAPRIDRRHASHATSARLPGLR